MTTVDSSSLHPDAIADLTQSVTGRVVLPSDPEYEAVSAVYGAVFGHTSAPAVIVQVADAGDVSVAIGFARRHGLELSVRSGGHSSSGFSTNVGGLVIDLRRINRVEIVDRERGVVRIGAGAIWGDVATTLGAEGLALTSGDTVSVGVGGLAVGGGIGWLVRTDGLTVDRLIEASVVTASGELVHASADENPDLLWALRGGGGNFGVVTSFTFVARPLAGVVAGTLQFPGADLADLLTRWRDAMRVAPEELNSTFLSMPDFPGMPGGVQILVCYAGDDAAAADAAIAPLRAFPGLSGDDVRAQPYADVLEEAHPPEGMTVIVHNAFARELSDTVIASLTTMYTAVGGSVLMIRSLTGAFNRVPNDATAFAFRDSEALVISAAFLPSDAPATASERIHQLWGALAPQLQGIYTGFSSAVNGEDPALIYPQETLARLVAVKRAYDPENVFRRNHNIPPDLQV